MQERENNLIHQGVTSDPPFEEERKRSDTSILLFGSVAVLVIALVRKTS